MGGQMAQGLLSKACLFVGREVPKVRNFGVFLFFELVEKGMRQGHEGLDALIRIVPSLGDKLYTTIFLTKSTNWG